MKREEGLGLAQLLDYVRILSEEIGPRGPTTAKEAEAGRYVMSRLKEQGLKVLMQEFRAPSSFSWAFLVYYLGALIGAVLYGFNPLVTVILGGLMAAGYFLEGNTYPVLAPLMPGGKSANIVGKYAPWRDARRRVVVMAHYDSSRAALNFSPKLVKGFRQSYLITSAAILLAPLAGLGGFFASPGQAVWQLLYAVEILLALVLLFPVITLVHREIFGKFTPGANDNASGVSVMLGVGDLLAQGELAATEVWLVATGAEESGTNGAINFIKEHGEQLRDSLFINLDNLGSGNLKFITREGMLWTYPADSELVSLARRAVAGFAGPGPLIGQGQVETAATAPEAREGGSEGDSDGDNGGNGVKGPLSIGPAQYRTLTTDGLALAARGHRVMGVMAFDDDGVLPNWHWPTDVIENVNGNNLEEARELVWRIIKQVDARATS